MDFSHDQKFELVAGRSCTNAKVLFLHSNVDLQCICVVGEKTKRCDYCSHMLKAAESQFLHLCFLYQCTHSFLIADMKNREHVKCFNAWTSFSDRAEFLCFSGRCQRELKSQSSETIHHDFLNCRQCMHDLHPSSLLCYNLMLVNWAFHKPKKGRNSAHITER